MKLQHFQIMRCSNAPKGAVVFSDGVIWAAKGDSTSAAVWLQSSEFQTGDLERALEVLLAEVGDLEGFKLVGCARLVAEVGRFCRKKNLRILNQAVRDGAFEARFSQEECKILVTRRLRVLIVDDSQTMRTLFQRVLSSDPAIEVAGSADRPSTALRMIEELKPDVITLDMEMPEKDGVAFLKEYLPAHPIPTVLVSAISLEDGPKVLQALEAGAVDYVQKPGADELPEVAPVLIEKIKAAGGARILSRTVRSAPKTLKAPGGVEGGLDLSTLVAIGSSTGGTEALRILLTRLPAGIPPIVITQHIPAVFSKAFAERMNRLCPFTVTEGADGMEVLPGHVYIAPGGFQMKVVKRGRRLVIEVNDSPPMNRHKPSVDYLFQSVAEICGGKSIGVILTGMGADGAEGLLQMRKAGARTLAQNEKTCAVFGMPREAIERGAADEVLGIEEIPEKLIQWLSHRKAA